MIANAMLSLCVRAAPIIPLQILLILKIFPAKSIRHKTAYKADNIARRWLRRRGGREPYAAEGL
jgi:hypothetical protein